MLFYLFSLIYIVVIGLISIFLTVKDKQSAKKGKWRTKESVLLLFAAIGGALPMYLCMKKIHHKTLKAKFMITLPLMFLMHIIVIVLFFLKLNIFTNF